jgi:hypothetical protein
MFHHVLYNLESLIIVAEHSVLKLDLFPFSAEGVGDTYFVGCVKKSRPQSLGLEVSFF